LFSWGLGVIFLGYVERLWLWVSAFAGTTIEFRP
jgi:hypothetical protein